MKTAAFVLSILMSVSIASAEPVVFIVRHAEKSGDGKDPDLSAAGQTRAEILVRILKDAGITAIFTSEFKRTQETAAPIAKSIGITPTVVQAKDTAALVAKLHQLNGNALVVGHGNTIPELIKAFGIETTIEIPENDYTQLLIVLLGEKPRLLRLHYP